MSADARNGGNPGDMISLQGRRQVCGQKWWCRGFLASLTFLHASNNACEAFFPGKRSRMQKAENNRRESSIHAKLPGPSGDFDDVLYLGKPLYPAMTTDHEQSQSIASGGTNRRGAMSAIAASCLLPSLGAHAGGASSDRLEDLLLGDGRWEPLGRPQSIDGNGVVVPPSFCTYAARFLIHFDYGVKDWWNNLNQSYSRLEEGKRRTKLGRSFGCLAKSIELAILELQQQQRQRLNSRESYGKLWDLFLSRYGREPDAKRQIALLFATLPDNQQPVKQMRKVVSKAGPSSSESSNYAEDVKEKAVFREERLLAAADTTNPPPSVLVEDLSSLLPSEFRCVPSSSAFVISPPISLFEVGVDEEFGQTATATAFGPLASQPLTRGLPQYSLNTYALFGLSGATGCALTHTVVIPLDVVKTRAQTDPEQYKKVIEGASLIVEREGIKGLLLGAQATIAGYFWYGLSVYPSYTFFKRLFSLGVLPPDIAAVHANDIALVAGALAAVIASLGLTPLEAARIRAVAEPEKYESIGLFGTLDVIAKEDPSLGWKTLYAGFPSLLARQVIFGSIKFLAFERACELIFMIWPMLRDSTWTSLAVSLVAGGFSGTLSSVVSQPADSVLTYVAQNSEGMASLGVLEGCVLMVEKEGIGSLYRGLGSRCVWAGSIIAGQFLLYDIFRTVFGVNENDLSQIYQVVLPTAGTG